MSQKKVMKLVKIVCESTLVTVTVTVTVVVYKTVTGAVVSPNGSTLLGS